MEIDQVSYAGFWRRFGSFWIDVAVLLPITGLNLLFSEKSRLFQVYFLIPNLIIMTWFHIYLVKRYGGTPGKLITKTRILKLDGSPVDFKTATLRYSVVLAFDVLIGIAITIALFKMSDAQYLSMNALERSKEIVENAPSWYNWVNWTMQAWLMSEFIVILTNKKRRALHDYMAGTIVAVAELKSPKLTS